MLASADRRKLTFALQNLATDFESDVDDDATRQVAFILRRAAHEDFPVTRTGIEVRLASRVRPFAVSHSAA